MQYLFVFVCTRCHRGVSDLRPRYATCNPKVITALTEDYKALMLRKLMIQTRISIAPSALTELNARDQD
jgi:hypothetical protein